ncbi:hypothetical protein VNO78_14658 [Psophocarpus tetragonolobus]|uniref:Uncharacterized protein n=1 Tax=Psophocarpus tetragonolobus TaxID=3891 RepID=A0AAN9XJ06_PSOTE
MSCASSTHQTRASSLASILLIKNGPLEALDSVAHQRRIDRPNPKSKWAGTRLGVGMTAAVGTRLALQWILVKEFRLYSFQLRDLGTSRI